jgi:hypothetical protein
MQTMTPAATFNFSASAGDAGGEVSAVDGGGIKVVDGRFDPSKPML